ncbi:MAG: hypothetical protein ABIK47_02810 [candidate division WOR-3 bacterium]
MLLGVDIRAAVVANGKDVNIAVVVDIGKLQFGPATLKLGILKPVGAFNIT